MAPTADSLVPPAEHALVVGGTGMLREAALALGTGARALTAVARTPARLESLESEVARLGGRAVGVALDYRDAEALRAALAARASEDGPFDLALCWIHGTAPDAPAVVARHVRADGGRFFHVLPDRARDEEAARRLRDPVIEANPDVRYRRVLLGSVAVNGGRRWLTHDEISAGALEAIRSDADHLVGDA